MNAQPRDSAEFDLTAAQLGMWFAEALSPEYSVTIAQYLDIRDRERTLDIPLFCAVAKQTGRDTESAFTRIVERDGVPKQVVDLSIDNSVEVIDLREHPDPIAAARRWMDDDYQRTMSLDTDVLVTSALLRVADDRNFWYVRAHHIALDGYAALTSVRAVLDRYNAARNGRELENRPAADLRAVVDDDLAYRTSSRRTSDREHWLGRVRDLPERVTLATRSRTAALSAQNLVAGRTLEPDLQREIGDVAREWGSSTAVLLTSAFSAYLARMAGTDDVVVSLPVTGRATAKIKRASGMVANMLPVRARQVYSCTLRDLTEQVQLEMTGALRHQRYRFEDIRADAGLHDSSTASFGPIVNLMLFDQPIEIDGAAVDYHILSSGILEDLRVNLYQATPGAPLRVDMHGNPDLYTVDELEGLVGRFIRFLTRLVEDPYRPIADVDLLAAGESGDLLAAGRGPRVAFGDHEGHLLDEYLRQVDQTPDATAVCVGDSEWTYAEFDRERRVLTAELRAAGVCRGDRVAVCLERGIEQVVVFYAVVGLGAAYVPIDPADPAPRRRLIIDTVGARVVVDPEFLVAACEVGEDRAVSAGPVGGGEDPAYVIFTSGSTGIPKGVVVSHAAVRNRLAWMQRDFSIGPDDVVLYKTPATFDVSVWELFWPLREGARMVVAYPGGHRDPQYLRELILARGVTVAHFVPSMLDVFTEVAGPREGDEDVAPPADDPFGPTVRMVFTSGEALTRQLADRVPTPGRRLINLYGPTEAAVDVTEWVVEPGGDVVPIGTPVANTSLMVLDARLRPVPVGVAGELYLAGRQLAHGYVGRTALTSERFVANPFGPGGSRMYRTGDLVRLTRHGAFEYLGRLDFQIKIRGQRVELGEIESALTGLAGVDAAVVVARDDMGPEPVLVAYLKSVRESAQADVLAVCRRLLPSHMVPNAVVTLEEFPTTSSGKLDRKSLPKPSPAVSSGHVEPQTDVAKAIAGLVAELSGTTRVGMRDNLFGLGLDSLKAARLVNRLRAGHGIAVDLVDVFAARDIGEIAALAQARGQLEATPRLRRIHPRPDVIPLSPAQTRLWFLNRLNPAAGIYNMPGAVRTGPDTDVAAMRAALRDVVTRHEPLRTRFGSHGGEPVQEVLEPEQAFALLDLEVGTHHGTAEQFVADEATRGFDLMTEIPFRARIVGDGDGYLVLVVVHHIAGDGYSLRPLIADLLGAYEARRTGAPGQPPLPVQYADYALWQQELLGDEQNPTELMTDGLRFWEAELDGLPPLLPLPTDRPRPHVGSGAGGYLDTSVSGELAHGIRQVARTLNVTAFAVMHSALTLVLSRWAEADDIAVGTAVAGRDDPATEDMVGMFVNTIVLRTPVRPYDSAADLIVRAHDVRTRSLAHADIPFERVVDAASTQRSSSYSPLFQVAFTQYTGQSAIIGELAPGVRVVDVRPPAAKFDLSVSVTDRPSGPGFDIEISYATDLFDEGTVTAFSHRLLTALTAIVDDPQVRLGAIDLAPRSERGALTTSGASIAAAATLRELLAAGAAMADSQAVAIAGRRVITWSSFEAQSNQLARELISRNIGAGQVVALCLGRSAVSVLALAAVVKSGAAFVSIDPRHPMVRREAILRDSDAVLGLTSTALAGETPGGVEWIAIDDASVELQLAGHCGTAVDAAELTRVPTLDDVAYLIYTSGSTGTPKAAVLSHRGLANLVANQRQILGVGPSSRVLHVASPSFDASIFEITMALCSGGRLVVSPAEVFGGSELAELISSEQVTHAVMTPSALSTLEPTAVRGLRTVISVGETCPPDLMRRWSRAGHEFHNLYGPTEATIWATAAGPLSADEPVTIGTPIPGVGAHILDLHLRPVPRGLPGELYLCGDQLALGYHRRPGLTSSAYVADPFMVGRRMYRTGDRVRLTPTGELTYLGRKDFQLKIRGLRIEPGEIDSAVGAHPAVAEMVTTAVAGPAGDDVLVTYVSLIAGAVVEPGEIREFAAARLPGYLVPFAISIVPAFELTRSGKIDRSRLPKVDFATYATYVAPHTEFERVVAEIYGQVLDRGRVSRTEDFFDIGGNSLSATKVTSRLSAALARQVPVRLLFDHPTVCGLARELSALDTVTSTPVLRARDHTQVVPISEMQRGMWLINRADPASPAYNVAMALRLSGALNPEALRAAFADVVARHESLRTIYPMVGGRPVQMISPPGSPEAQVVMPVRQVTDMAAAIAGVTGRGFDLTSETSIRAAVFTDRPDDHVVVLVVHHISADGASMAPLARDLLAAYVARTAGAEARWTPLPIQYADYSLWQAERLAVEAPNGDTVRDRQLDYWRRRLAGAPPLLDLPADRPRPAVPGHHGAVVDLELPGELVDSLITLARNTNSTLFMVTHAALAVLLHRVTGSGDMVIGTPFANRGHAGLEDVVGMFVNTLAMRTTVAPDDDFAMLLDRVRRDDLADMSNTDVAFDAVVAAVLPKPPTAYNPLFQVMFSFQNIEMPTLQLEDFSATPIAEELSSAKVDLQLTLFDDDPQSSAGGRSMRAQMLYATELFDEQTVRRLAARYLRVLDAVAADPHVRIAGIDIRLPEEHSAAISAQAEPDGLPAAVAAAARTRPEATAVAREGAEVTFSDLDGLAETFTAATPDRDAALTMALMTLLPQLAGAGASEFDAVLREVDGRAERVNSTQARSADTEGI